MKLYAHPFSSYCQKVLIALYENATPFEFCMLAPDHEQNAAEHAALWPLRKMPVLATATARSWRRASSSSISVCGIPARCG